MHTAAGLDIFEHTVEHGNKPAFSFDLLCDNAFRIHQLLRVLGLGLCRWRTGRNLWFRQLQRGLQRDSTHY